MKTPELFYCGQHVEGLFGHPAWHQATCQPGVPLLSACLPHAELLFAHLWLQAGALVCPGDAYTDKRDNRLRKDQATSLQENQGTLRNAGIAQKERPLIFTNRR